VTEQQTDVLIVGGGVGGVAAALAAARMGRRVVMAEETDWIGGQFTSQAVPPDEHQWMEQFGGTRSYRALRTAARQYYRDHYPLTNAARQEIELNPGAPLVTRMSCEPRVWLAVMEALLAPYRAAGRVTVWLRHRPLTVEMDGDRVRAVTLLDLDTGLHRTFSAPYVLDATELGDLLPLGGVEYVTGRESQAETGEPHAVQGPAQPHVMQAITFVFALDYVPGEDHTIPRPDTYETWRPHFRWPPPDSPAPVELFPDPKTEIFSLWRYRRILYKGHFDPGFFPSDVVLLNWRNDYPFGPIIAVPEDEAAKHLYQAREMSLSHLYWLQVDAPRPDGGTGYPGLRLRPDVVGTNDGLAKYPYIRESRRIKAEFTVLEQHVGAVARAAVYGREVDGAEPFPDSVGIGRYGLDIHGCTPLAPGGPPARTRLDPIGPYGSETGGDTPDGGHVLHTHDVWPFQIPLGALIPIRVENLLAAGKNIGVTHLSNSCYRLHPIEWNTGEAAGALAAFCLDRGYTPRQVRNTPALMEAFQLLLRRQGVDIAWPKIGPGRSYHKWAITQKDWWWGETDLP
jgi:hypothetical protein